MANRKVHRWTMTGDIALAKAVLGIRPETKEEWDSLTELLNDELSPKTVITKRNCEEHLELIIKRHRKGERVNLAA